MKLQITIIVVAIFALHTNIFAAGDMGLLNVTASEAVGQVEQTDEEVAAAPTASEFSNYQFTESDASSRQAATLSELLNYLGLAQGTVVAGSYNAPINWQNAQRLHQWTSGQVNETTIYTRNGQRLNIYHQDGRNPTYNPPGLDVTCYCESARKGRPGANPCAAGNSGVANVLYVPGPRGGQIRVWGR